MIKYLYNTITLLTNISFTNLDTDHVSLVIYTIGNKTPPPTITSVVSSENTL